MYRIYPHLRGYLSPNQLTTIPQPADSCPPSVEKVHLVAGSAAANSPEIPWFVRWGFSYKLSPQRICLHASALHWQVTQAAKGI
jgi:hypothetical protein